MNTSVAQRPQPSVPPIHSFEGFRASPVRVEMPQVSGGMWQEKKENKMFDPHHFSGIQNLIESGRIEAGLHFLAGMLVSPEAGYAARPVLQDHRLHELLMTDPYLQRAYAKPRGYAGDAKLIDMIYDQRPPENTAPLGRDMFAVTTNFAVSEAVRLRRKFAEERLTAEWKAGKRICSLACGHFREGDALIGEDLGNVTLVDQDSKSLDVVAGHHNGRVNRELANVLHWLRSAASRGEKYDLIYTLGLTDYLDDRAMRLLHKLAKLCLHDDGRLLLANFRPDHAARGWLHAVMDWNLIYRTEEDLAEFAIGAGLAAHTWSDPTACIAWCEMRLV